MKRIALILSLALLTAMPAVSKKRKAPEPPLVLRYEADPSRCVVILKDTSRGSTWNRYSDQIRGVAQNQCTYDLGFVALGYDLAYKDGTKFAEALAITQRLGSGQKWSFVALTTGDARWADRATPRVQARAE